MQGHNISLLETENPAVASDRVSVKGILDNTSVSYYTGRL